MHIGIFLPAWKNWMEGTATNVIDPILRDSPITDIIRCIHIGLLCVQTHAVARPNMTSVVAMINNDSITLLYLHDLHISRRVMLYWTHHCNKTLVLM